MSWITGTWISVKPPAIKSDRLNDLEGEMSDYERLACFRHGFRLAGRLLMELLP